MTSLITDDSDGPGLDGAPPRSRTGFPRPRPAPPSVSSTLHRLSSMALLRTWEQRSTPALMHDAILRGVSAHHAAEAARLTVAEAHLRWGAWASRRLTPQQVGTAADLSVQQFLSVHAAFAAALAREERPCPGG
ncbi:hypothetical protein [Amycolatopsis silviterrae]|uniref:Transcriptional regulator n=1 Tax=Amycolatopsis silviterrae TaxID=1656914 RepID=A0ABW5H6B5_9PSEU